MSMEEAPGDSAQAPAMASRVSAPHIVVDVEDDDDDGTAASTPAALRFRAIRAAAPLPFLDAFSSSPAVPKRRMPASPILLDDDTPPPSKRRPSVTPGSVAPETPDWYAPCSSPRPRAATPDTPDSVLRSSFPGSLDPDIVDLDTPGSPPIGPSTASIVPETPQSFVPCSLSPRPRAGVVLDMPDPILPRSFELDFDAADLGTPEPAFPGSVDPNTVVAEARFIPASRFDVAGPSTFPGPSSPISLDSDDDLDDFGYKEPSDNLILPFEDSTLQEEVNNNNAEERMTKQVDLDTPGFTLSPPIGPSTASIVRETPQSFVPCSLSPRPRGGVVLDMPDPVLPRSFELDFDAADLGTPELAFPGSVDPNIVVAETRFIPASFFDVAGPSTFPGSSSPISLDSDDDLDDFGYKKPSDNLILPFEGSTLQEEVNNNNAEERMTKQVDLDTLGFTLSPPIGPSAVSIVPETPQSSVPCSLSPRPRGGVVLDMPDPVLPRSFELDFDAADLEIPGPAFPGYVDPNIVVTETRFIPASLFDVAGPSTFPGPSPISLDSDDDLDDFGYKEPSDNLLLPFEEEDFTLQDEVKNNNAEERMTKQERRKLIKEGRAKLIEEKKRQREENKLLKEATKAQKAEQKKYTKEKEDWESGKHALKSIVAEIDSTIIESGSVGGSLLTRFAEKGLKYRIQVNPIRGSILWKMEIPQIGQDPASVSEVPYILFVLQAEEFCDLIGGGFFYDHVREVQSRYPTYTICYVTNKLMNYLNKCERTQYRNPSCSNSWKRPPVEEVFCKLATHYSRVHSRQCADEAEVAEHVVGLTSSLANCKFRKPLSWLSVHANGAVIPKNFIDKDLAKKDTWMKALIAIPKVQPRFALAIWKKYGTMRSLLNVYMDPAKTDREKELLLQDLKCEDRLGEESRRVGPVCSKRVYKTLMSQDGGAEADAGE